MKVLKECTRFLRSAQHCLQDQPQNELVIRIQPDEAIYYRSIVLGQGRLLDKHSLASSKLNVTCVCVLQIGNVKFLMRARACLVCWFATVLL